MAYDLTGKVKVIQDAQTFGSGFTKREFVVTDSSNEKYQQDINLEMVQDNVPKLDSVNVGDDVTVTFDIRGNEYNGRYFNNLQAWKIKVNAQGDTAASQPETPELPEDDSDDLPF